MYITNKIKGLKMGLDMTAYAVDPTADNTQEPTKLAEWRKHHVFLQLNDRGL